MQRIVRDETGHRWVVGDGDALAQIWANHPWLPDSIVVPRRFFTESGMGHPAPASTTVTYTDALDDDKLRQVMKAHVFELLDSEEYGI